MPTMVPQARGKALEAAECKTIDAEMKTLEASGLKGDLDKGVEWAKANLAGSRMEQVKVYLDLREKVLFRCPSLVVATPAGTSAGKKKLKNDADGEETEGDAEVTGSLKPISNR